MQAAPKRRRSRDPLWARLIVILGAVLMMGSGAAVVVTRVAINQATSNITTTNLIGGDAAATRKRGGATISGAINVLLVGIDVRPTGGADQGARADTIVILHIPASHDQGYLLSIPRDWRVDIPPYPKTGFKGWATKINAAFDEGYRGGGTELEKRARGVDLLAQTINKRTGITFNGAAIIDFSGFEAVVRELGGVDMCVDQRAQSIHLAYDRNGRIVRVWFDEKSHKVRGIPAGGRPVVHEKGCRHMSAELALDFSRIRYGLKNTDYDRQRHQQQLIKAIAQQATSAGMLTDLGKLNRVIGAAGKAFVLDTQGVPAEDFLFTLKGLAANDLVMVKTNNGTFNSVNVGGVAYESLSDESLSMLGAVRDGTLPAFLIAHPTFVSSSTTS
jgi:LCP family protein required for cell wall assembly